MWDYDINEDNDLFIDSSGDLAVIGNNENSHQNRKVINKDIQLAIYMNDIDLYDLQDTNLIRSQIRRIFEDDGRIKNINVFSTNNSNFNITYDLEG